MEVASPVLSSLEMSQVLDTLVTEVHQATQSADNLAVIGVHGGGVPAARRFAQRLGELRQATLEVGTLDVSMHRDDLDQRFAPDIRPTDIPFDVNGRNILMVDDVFGTGRTIRAALESLHEFGRPARVWLAVVIDMGGRELPIKPDFTGKFVSTEPGETVKVHFQEDGGQDEAFLERK